MLTYMPNTRKKLIFCSYCSIAGSRLLISFFGLYSHIQKPGPLEVLNQLSNPSQSVHKTSYSQLAENLFTRTYLLFYTGEHRVTSETPVGKHGGYSSKVTLKTHSWISIETNKWKPIFVPYTERNECLTLVTMLALSTRFADPDPSFHFDARIRIPLFTLMPGSGFNFPLWCEIGSCSSSKWCKSATTGVQTLHDSIWSLRASIVSFQCSWSNGYILSLYGSWILTLMQIRI